MLMCSHIHTNIFAYSNPATVPAKPCVRGLTDDMTSNSIRIGSVNYIIAHIDCELIHAILRGGWDFAGECNIFVYLGQFFATISVGGKALAGWENARQHVAAPSCVFITDANRCQVANFISALFPSNMPMFILGGKLRPLLDGMLASLLMYMQPMMDKYSANHIVILKLVEVARTHGYNTACLKDWGDQVRSDWERRNLCASAGSNDPAKMQALQQEVITLNSKLDNLDHAVAEQSNLIRQMHSMLVDLTQQLSQPRPPSTRSPAKRTADEAFGSAETALQPYSLTTTTTSSSSSSSSSSQLGTISPQVARPTAFDQMMNRQAHHVEYKLASLEGVECQDVLRKWFKYNLAGNKTYSSDASIRRDVSAVCTYMISIALPAELTAIRQLEPDATLEPTLWAVWSQSSLAAALAIQARMLDNLAVREGRLPGQSTKAQASVSTIRKRLSKKP